MKFEDFLKKVSPKIGPSSAFDLARDAKMNAIKDVIIRKGFITEKEFEEIIGKNLDKIAIDIEKMPPFVK